MSESITWWIHRRVWIDNLPMTDALGRPMTCRGLYGFGIVMGFERRNERVVAHVELCDSTRGRGCVVAVPEENLVLPLVQVPPPPPVNNSVLIYG